MRTRIFQETADAVEVMAQDSFDVTFVLSQTGAAYHFVRLLDSGVNNSGSINPETNRKNLTNIYAHKHL